MEIFLKSINNEISTFCTWSAGQPRKNQIFKKYSRINQVWDLANLPKVLVWKDKLLNMILVNCFICYYFLSIHMVQTKLGGVFIYRESLRQTSALLWLGLKQKCIFPFSRIFIYLCKFRVNRPNIPIFSRKCQQNSHDSFCFGKIFMTIIIFLHKNTFFHSAARSCSCLAHIIEKVFCENAQVKNLSEKSGKISSHSKFVQNGPFVSHVPEALLFCEFFCHFHKRQFRITAKMNILVSTLLLAEFASMTTSQNHKHASHESNFPLVS